MPNVSSSIPNLINGVSQQPPHIRLVSQGERQVNGLSSEVDGLRKRPPSRYIDLVWDLADTSVDPPADFDENAQRQPAISGTSSEVFLFTFLDYQSYTNGTNSLKAEWSASYLGQDIDLEIHFAKTSHTYNPGGGCSLAVTAGEYFIYLLDDRFSVSSPDPTGWLEKAPDITLNDLGVFRGTHDFGTECQVGGSSSQPDLSL